MEAVGFFILVVFAWAVVVPIAALLSASKHKRRVAEAEERARQRGLAALGFARALLGLEWRGAWRDAKQKPPPGAHAVGPARAAHAEPQPGTQLEPIADHLHPAAPAGLALAADAPAAQVALAADARAAHGALAASVPVASPAAAAASSAPIVEAVLAAPPEPIADRARPALAAPARGSDAEAREAVARYSAWREHVRPFLVENIGWFIGGFLIVAGSLYFLREAWGSFNQLGRQLLIVATALAYAGGFIGVGLWLKRSHGLDTASRAMAYVGLALLPVAGLAASGTFEIRPWAWGLLGPVSVALAYPLLYLAAGLLDRPLAAPLARALAALLALLVLLPGANALSPQAALALPYVGWLVLHLASAAPLRGTAAPSPGVLAFHLSALAYTLLFTLGRAHALGQSALPFPAFYGPLTVLLSFTALRVDVELRARWKAQPILDAAVLASFAGALSGIALAAREPAYLALGAALAAAHFAAAIAWYRRPVLLYFSLASAAASALSLCMALPAPLLLLDAAALRVAGRSAASAEVTCAAALVLALLAFAASELAARFRARDEHRLAAAGDRGAWLLLLFGCLAAAPALGDGRRLAPALAFATCGALIAQWHLRRPRQLTAWTSSLFLGGAVTLFALRSVTTTGAALSVAGAVLAASAAASFFRPGERRGSSALWHWALLFSGLGALSGLLLQTAGLQLVAFTVIAAAAALALGSALPGLLASCGALALLAVALLGPQALWTVPAADLRWAALPAAAIAAAFALRLAGERGLRTLHTFLPFPASGLRALGDPLQLCASAAMALLALRALFAPDGTGALMLAASGACALALGALARDGRWAATAVPMLALAGAYQAAALLGFRPGPLALGAASATLACALAARAVRSRLQEAASSALASVAVTAGAAATLALLSWTAGSNGGEPARACAALAFSAVSLLWLAPEVARWPGLAALACAAALLPLALGMPDARAGSALAALALLLLWSKKALRDAPPWIALGHVAVAAAALGWNLGRPGAFLDWERASCDGLLLAYLGSALYIEGGAVWVHLLMMLAGLGVVRARTILGIQPSGWGTVVVGAALLGLGAALGKPREKYANALFIWSGLSLAYTCEWCFGGSAAPFVRADRANRMLLSALVMVPLAPRFFPQIASGAAVVALSAAALGLLAPLWTPLTWPLAPAALALGLALLAEALQRVEDRRFCAPEELRSSLRVGALLIAIVPAGLAAWTVVAAALRLPGVSAAGPGALAAAPLVLGGLSLALVFRRLDDAAWFGWPLTVCGALGLTALLLPSFSEFTPGGGALVLLALAVVASVLARQFEELAWGARGLWLASLFATHLSPREWTTGASILAGAWFLRGAALPSPLSLPLWSALAAAGFGLSYAQTRFGVAAPLGLLAAALALWSERRPRLADALGFAVAAGVALVVGAQADSPAAVAPCVLGGAALLLALCASRARTDERFLYAAALPAVAAWIWARSALGLFSGWAAADTVFALGAAFALALLQSALHSAPLARLALALPICALYAAPPGALTTAAGAAAALYGLLAWLRQSRLAAYAAVTLVNVALFASWQQRGLDDAQLYTVPLGLSLIAAAQISHRDLSRQNLSWLRGLGCLVLYAGTALQMLRFDDSSLYPLLLGGLALCTVVAGVMLQIRAFAWLGAATLVADVLANLVRASAHNSRIMAVSATLTGFAILGGMIWLSVKREETLALYRRLVRAMDDWE